MEFKEKIRKILDEREWKAVDRADLACAAVLIPLYSRGGKRYVLLTKRTNKVHHHKGQISFPGGRKKEGERLRETALRETKEEVGIKRSQVEILGKLDQVQTISNFLVTPYVGIISPPYLFTPNPEEVEEIIEVPLDFLLDESNVRVGIFHLQRKSMMSGMESRYYLYKDHVIWGATARMLLKFKEVLGDCLKKEVEHI
nr:CoA pyrophosphatase [Desulfobacterales bacterium]